MSEVLILETQVRLPLALQAANWTARSALVSTTASRCYAADNDGAGRQRKGDDKEPSGRRDELLFIPERSSVLFSFSFWLSFLFIFENVPSRLQAAGACRHKGAIN